MSQQVRLLVGNEGDRDPIDILREALARHERVALSFSGAEDVALIDMVARLASGERAGLRLFSLDTGRLHPETYRFFETVREHYELPFDLLLPDAAAVGAMTATKGLFSFYKDGHGECCALRKIEPLQRYLVNVDAWITGQRRDQSVTRVHVPQIQDDRAFRGRDDTLMKYNPLAAWSSADVWRYIRNNGVPYNALHDRGFVSIGCEPCTRAIAPHEHERAGRWWWEEATKKECGLHTSNTEHVGTHR